MVRVSYIPRQVLDVIRGHIGGAVKRCLTNYASAYEKEDALTGYLFGALQIQDQHIMVSGQDFDELWKWGIDFKTFGGGGKGSSESVLGADGIIELALHDRNGVLSKKSLLFQAKVDWTNTDNRLYTQCQKLMTWWGAAIVVNYTELEFTAYGVESVFSQNSSRPANGIPLEEMLGNEFIVCKIGDSDLEYDAVRKILIWRNRDQQVVYTKFNINRRLRINIHTPRPTQLKDEGDMKELKHSELYRNLLNSKEYNPGILYAGAEELKKMKKTYSKILHPDRHRRLPAAQAEFFGEILTAYNTLFAKRDEALRAITNSRISNPMTMLN